MAQAAGSKIQLEDVKQTVTCGICLQLYTDPRVLTCEHTYCLICLQGFQTSSSNSKNCPVCREKTIPIKQDLDGLPENELAKQLVMLVHTYEPETKEEAPQWREPKNSVDKESSDSDSSDEDSDDDGELHSRIAALMMLNSDLSGLAGLLGLNSDSDNDGNDTEERGVRHRYVKCDSCHGGVYGARYKCGFCEDFDLCEECEKKPRSESHPTDEPHLFVKMKKPRTADPAMQRILGDDSMTMAMTMDVSKTEHVLYLSETETKMINCDNCGTAPISGVRYKCGVCADYDLCEECEKHSEDFHDEEHIFLVFKHPTAFHTTEPQLMYNFYETQEA